MFFSTWKYRYTYSFRCSAPHVLKMYFLSEETVTHIRFKIRGSEPQRKKRKWLKCFSPLEKTVTHMLFADSTLLLKDVLPFRKTVTHIRFKIRVSEPQTWKQVMCFSPLEKTVTHMLFADSALCFKDVFPFRKNRYTYSFQDHFSQ